VITAGVLRLRALERNLVVGQSPPLIESEFSMAESYANVDDLRVRFGARVNSRVHYLYHLLLAVLRSSVRPWRPGP
jgi:hypothetical protein